MSDRTSIRITVLISGNGSNLQALIDNSVKGRPLHSCQIIRVLSNRKDVRGLERAREANIPTSYHNLIPYKKKHPESIDVARSAYDKDLSDLVLADKPDLVVCAGFMHVLSPSFLDPLAQASVPIINLHPALPGAFNGARAIERAHQAWLDGKIQKTGCLIHEVIREVDMGDPVIVDEIPFVKGVDEDLGKFEAKLHEREHGLIVEGTRIMIERIRGRRKGGGEGE